MRVRLSLKTEQREFCGTLFKTKGQVPGIGLKFLVFTADLRYRDSGEKLFPLTWTRSTGHHLLRGEKFSQLAELLQGEVELEKVHAELLGRDVVDVRLVDVIRHAQALQLGRHVLPQLQAPQSASTAQPVRKKHL